MFKLRTFTSSQAVILMRSADGFDEHMLTGIEGGSRWKDPDPGDLPAGLAASASRSLVLGSQPDCANAT